MAGDNEAAAMSATDFGWWLQKVFDEASEEQRSILRLLQQLWGIWHKLAGHKRIGRALLAIDMNKERP